MPTGNRKFYKYNVEGEYFDEDSGIIKEIIYYPDTKEITFTFLDDSQKTIELANLVANTELSTLLARYITSDTLNITGTESSVDIEIKPKYRRPYLHELTLKMAFDRYNPETEEEIPVECGTFKAYAVTNDDERITADNIRDYHNFITIPAQLVELRTDEEVFNDNIHDAVFTEDGDIQMFILNTHEVTYYATELMGVYVIEVIDYY